MSAPEGSGDGDQAARNSGVNISANTYAYTAWFNTFSAFIPPWAHDLLSTFDGRISGLPVIHRLIGWDISAAGEV
jgi:hypothetical protein